MGYPVTQGGVLVDAWRIPIEEAEIYIRQREACAAQLIAEMETFCGRAYRDLAGTEDGEVVWGESVFGTEHSCLVFLDPQTVEAALEAAKKKELRKFILESNEMTELAAQLNFDSAK